MTYVSLLSLVFFTSYFSAIHFFVVLFTSLGLFHYAVNGFTYILIETFYHIE